MSDPTSLHSDEYLAGIDAGGTSISVKIFKLVNGNLTAMPEGEFSQATARGVIPHIDQVKAILQEIDRRVQQEGGDLIGVGISSPGNFDAHGNVVPNSSPMMGAPDFHAFDNVNLKERYQAAIADIPRLADIRITVQNDSEAMLSGMVSFVQAGGDNALLDQHGNTVNGTALPDRKIGVLGLGTGVGNAFAEFDSHGHMLSNAAGTVGALNLTIDEEDAPHFSRARERYILAGQKDIITLIDYVAFVTENQLGAAATFSATKINALAGVEKGEDIVIGNSEHDTALKIAGKYMGRTIAGIQAMEAAEQATVNSAKQTSMYLIGGGIGSSPLGDEIIRYAQEEMERLGITSPALVRMPQHMAECGAAATVLNDLMRTPSFTLAASHPLSLENGRVYGADGAYNLQLPDGNRLWAFGDTLVGPSAEGRPVDPNMYHNSLGVETRDGEMHYFLGSADQPLIPHNSHPDHSKGEWACPTGQGYFGNSRPGECYWPADMVNINDTVAFFLRRVAPVPPGGEMWDFQMRGTDVAVLQNPEDAPDAWRFKITPVNENERTVGVAAEVKDNTVFLLENDPAQGHALFLARMTVDDMLRGHPNISYYHADTGEWMPSQPSTPLFSPGAPEASLKYDPEKDQWRIIYQEGFEHTVLMRSADQITGPWGAPVKVHSTSSTRPDIYHYAAKEVDNGQRRDGKVDIVLCSNSLNGLEGLQQERDYVPTIFSFDTHPKMQPAHQPNAEESVSSRKSSGGAQAHHANDRGYRYYRSPPRFPPKVGSEGAGWSRNVLTGRSKGGADIER